MPFAKGQSGNPAGRRKESGDLRELARAACPRMLEHLIALADNEETPVKSRITAATHILDRGYGKPAQTLGDEDGNSVSWIDVIRAARGRIDD